MGTTRVLGAAQSSMQHRGTAAGQLAAQAAKDALAAADLAPTGLAAVVMANALGDPGSQHMIRAQTWLRGLGFGDVPVLNVENACAGGVTALHLASALAGDGPVLALGVDTMWHAPRDEVAPVLEHGVADEDRPGLRRDAGDLPLLVAHSARRASAFVGSGRATRGDLVAAAVKATALGALNPDGWARRPLSEEEVLSAKPVGGPLTRVMCCPYTDGAAAVVVGPGTSGPVLRAVHLAGGDGSEGWFDRFPRVAAAAWERSGCSPGELDLVELHDVTTAEELESLEALGLFEPGAAAAATRRGATMPGSPGLAVNPSGGLVGRGHPLAATGLAQVVEVVDQLQGRCGPRQVPGARVGATFNMGGIVGDEPAVLGMAVLSAT